MAVASKKVINAAIVAVPEGRPAVDAGMTKKGYMIEEWGKRPEDIAEMGVTWLE